MFTVIYITLYFVYKMLKMVDIFNLNEDLKTGGT